MTRLRRDSGAKASHWWVRMGTKESGFACPIVVNLATALENEGYDVNFRLVWDGGHCAEDDIDVQLDWIHAITGYRP